MLDALPATRLDEANRMWGQPFADPMPSGCRPAWFVVVITSGQMALAEAALRADHWPCLFPLHVERHGSKRGTIVPLFPGYAFVEFSLADDHWPELYRTTGVLTVLSNNRKPTPLPTGFVDDLLARTSPRRIVDDPLITDLLPGAAVSVLRGPLAGLAGVVQMSAKNRCSVLLEALGAVSRVTLDRSDLAPLPQKQG